MEKDRIEFSITSLEQGGNSEPNGNVQIFSYINTICVFFKTIWRKNFRSQMKKGRIKFSISFLEPGKYFVQNVPVQLFCYILYSNYVFSKTIWKNDVAQWRLKDWRDWQ